MNSQLAAWITGIGAILFATMGVALAIREVRRKERHDAQVIIDGLERALLSEENAAIAWRQYVFALRVMLADHGIPAPDPPSLAEHVESSTLLYDGDADGRGLHRFRRRRRRRRGDTDNGSDPGSAGTTGAAG